MKVFRDRFNEHQVQPPTEMWDRICRDLDEPSLRFREVLKPASIAPPEGSWEQLQALLDKEPELNTTVPIIRHKRIIQPLTVAASLLVLILGGWWIGKQIMATTPSPIIENTPGNTSPIEQSKNASPPFIEQKENLLLTETNTRNSSTVGLVTEKKHSEKKSLTGYPGRSVEPSAKPELENLFTASYTPVPVIFSHEPFSQEKWDESVKTSDIADSHGQVREDIRHQDVPLGYIAVTNSAGHTAQLSAKLSRWKEFFFEENGHPQNSFSSDPEWEQKIRRWKSMVSNSELITASSGSLDITELIRMMQE